MPQLIFKDVFICHSRLTESWYCCNREKLNNERLLFICLASPLLMDCPAACLSSKKKKKKDNKVGALCFMRSFSVFNCQSSLLCICLSTSFSIFPCLEVRRLYRMWRVASGGQTWERLGVWLPYHSLWLILRHSLHYPELYAAIITPHPPACAGRPWPYRPIILPRRNATEGTPDI